MSKYINIINNLSYNFSVDMIVITHNPIVIIQNHLVYDFAERKIVSSLEYVNEEIGLSLKL